MAQAVAPVMKAQGKGRIIFTSSQAGLVARENQQPYCASKGGINAVSYTHLKEKGAAVLGIVNVVGSSIARESDYTLYTYCLLYTSRCV